MSDDRSPTWVVVADQARARLFKYAWHDGGLEEVEDIVFLQARVPQHELESDAGGMTPAHGHRDAYDPRAAAEAHAREEFAHAISDRLESKRLAGELACFYLVAEPRFLGALRGAIHAPLMGHLRGEVSRHMTQERIEQIQALLPRAT